MGKSYSRVSVIIPAYNSQATISACLGAVIPQAVSCGTEVIVVDSSSDDTPRIVARDFPSVKLMHLDRRTFASEARNIGVSESAGEILCFIDSDCIPQPNWLAGIVTEIYGGNTKVVCGGVLPANPRSATGLALFFLEFRPFHYLMPARDMRTFVTCNLALTRELFYRYGPFDPVWAGEDTLLAERIRAGGERIVFRPEHQVAHTNRTGWVAVLRHSNRVGRMTAQAMILSPTMPTRHWLQRAWLLCLLAPIAMPIRVITELGLAAPSTVLVTIPVAPLIALNYVAWGIGFVKSARERKILDQQASKTGQSMRKE